MWGSWPTRTSGSARGKLYRLLTHAGDRARRQDPADDPVELRLTVVPPLRPSARTACATFTFDPADCKRNATGRSWSAADPPAGAGAHVGRICRARRREERCEPRRGVRTGRAAAARLRCQRERRIESVRNQPGDVPTATRRTELLAAVRAAAGTCDARESLYSSTRDLRNRRTRPLRDHRHEVELVGGTTSPGVSSSAAAISPDVGARIGCAAAGSST